MKASGFAEHAAMEEALLYAAARASGEQELYLNI